MLLWTLIYKYKPCNLKMFRFNKHKLLCWFAKLSLSISLSISLVWLLRSAADLIPGLPQHCRLTCLLPTHPLKSLECVTDLWDSLRGVLSLLYLQPWGWGQARKRTWRGCSQWWPACVMDQWEKWGFDPLSLSLQVCAPCCKAKAGQSLMFGFGLEAGSRARPL
jgi:hypothetical protein